MWRTSGIATLFSTTRCNRKKNIWHFFAIVSTHHRKLSNHVFKFLSIYSSELATNLRLHRRHLKSRHLMLTILPMHRWVGLFTRFGCNRNKNYQILKSTCKSGSRYEYEYMSADYVFTYLAGSWSTAYVRHVRGRVNTVYSQSVWTARFVTIFIVSADYTPLFPTVWS